MIDGLDDRDQVVGTIKIFPNLESIGEFKMQVANTDAEFATGGAVVNVITRSGRNEIHGSAFEFLRNQDFDARRFFDARQAALPAKSVRRVDRRRHPEEQDVLLRRLPGAADALLRHLDQQRADRGHACGQLRAVPSRTGLTLRSQHLRRGDQHPPAIREQSDAQRAASIRSA